MVRGNQLSKQSMLFLFIVAALLLSNCVPRYAQVEYCDPDLQALLVDETAMPSSWNQADGQPTKNDEFSHGAINHCMITFHTSNGAAFEQIFQYETEQEAAADYMRMKELFFREDSKSFPAPSYDLTNADNFHLACAISTDTPMCGILAQYGVYIIDTNTHMSPDFMTNDDLVRVLQAIDEKMAQRDATH
jgi:hypothetical protein